MARPIVRLVLTRVKAGDVKYFVLMQASLIYQGEPVVFVRLFYTWV